MELFYRCLGFAADVTLYVVFMRNFPAAQLRRSVPLAGTLALLAGYTVYRLGFGYGVIASTRHDLILVAAEILLCCALARTVYELPPKLSLAEGLIFVIAVQVGRKVFFHVLTPLLPEEQPLAYLESQLVVILLKLALVRLVQPQRRDISEDSVHGLDLFLLLFALYPCFLMSFLNVDLEVFGWSWNVNLICYFTALLCAFIVKHSIADHCELRRVTRMGQLRQREYERLQQSQASEQEIRRMYHDLKHQLLALRQDPHRAEALLTEVESQLDHYRREVYADTPILNALLREKRDSARQENITIDVQARIPPCAALTELELCVVFGNALDNALEAVRRLDEPALRRVRINCLSEPGFWVVLFENPYQGALDLRSGLPVSTKRDAANHGIGLRSIRRCAEEHGGTIALSTAGQIFTLSVMIPLPAAVPQPACAAGSLG